MLNHPCGARCPSAPPPLLLLARSLPRAGAALGGSPGVRYKYIGKHRGAAAPEAAACRVAFRIAAAVAHCQAHGIVHRDIKPENVLVQTSPEDFRIVEQVWVQARVRVRARERRACV